MQKICVYIYISIYINCRFYSLLTHHQCCVCQENTKPAIQCEILTCGPHISNFKASFFIVRFPFIYVRGCIAWYVFGWGISPECYYASNHQQCNCLFNSLLRLTSMHQSFTLLIGRFLALRASNTESVSVSDDTTVVNSDLVPTGKRMCVSMVMIVLVIWF